VVGVVASASHRHTVRSETFKHWAVAATWPRLSLPWARSWRSCRTAGARRAVSDTASKAGSEGIGDGGGLSGVDVFIWVFLSRS
jgi:hypothetical protein